MSRVLKLSDVSALEDVTLGTTVLIARNTIDEKHIIKKVDTILLIRYKAGVYGAGPDNGEEGIWMTRFNREPSEEKLLAVEGFR